MSVTTYERAAAAGHRAGLNLIQFSRLVSFVRKNAKATGGDASKLATLAKQQVAGVSAIDWSALIQLILQILALFAK